MFSPGFVLLSSGGNNCVGGRDVVALIIVFACISALLVYL